MTDILNILYVIGGMVLLFGAAVFVHEFGHYWMARKCGLKVEAFAIGFGPKIVSWNRDGIEYSWRWIPAGGFVKLPQMITSETLEGSNKADEIPPASPWAKILVAFAGPFMNVVFAFAIASVIYFVGLPVLVNPSIIGFVEPGSTEEKLGIQPGDRIVGVNGQKTKSWQEVQMATILARTNVFEVVIDREGVRKSYVLKAEVNPEIGWKVLKLAPRDHPKVLEVFSDGAGAEAGLQAKDVVVSFAGVPIASREQLIDLIKKRGGQPTEMTVQRGPENKLTLRVTPKADPATGIGRIGVALGNNAVDVYQVERPGPTPWAQVVDVWDKTVSTFSALWHSKQTGVGAKDLSGPAGILAMLAAQLNTDYRLALNFLVLLNINLAILNLLPIPVLDGGHILLAIIERIRRRPLSVRVIEYTTTAFALLLITFMLYVTFFDIKRFGLWKAMFNSETQIEQAGSPEAPAPSGSTP